MKNRFITFPRNEIQYSQDIIAEVVSNADEIWWASAYLTNWPLSHKCIPKKSCSLCNIVIGSDFGITRKTALTDLLNWSKRTIANVFINESSGFHPKAIVWSKSNKYFALIGSSNLSVAAWSTNTELNIMTEITKREYSNLTDWFKTKVIGDSDILDNTWIASYKESKRTRNKGRSAISEINLKIQKLGKTDLSFPKSQQRVYVRNKNEFIRIVRLCANRKLSNSVFWQRMWDLLDGSWYGSPIWRINCKQANWQQTCKCLVEIFNSDSSQRDRIVKESIDLLESSQNPSRGAWLSEILCHHYPYAYPLINKPVKKWIRKNNLAQITNIPNGNSYLKISRIMRKILIQNKNRFNGLGEMDHAIWEKSRKSK
jgi:hypothetical protein